MKQMTNLLGLYGGCDTDELKRIRRLPSRWVALCTTFPSLVLYESGCYLLHSEQPASKKRAREDTEITGSGLSEEPVKQGKAKASAAGQSEENEDEGATGCGY
jgi:hypothetical protein